MRVLITGGAGYIGSSAASACADAGHDVVILDDLSTGREEYTRDFEFHHGDVGDPVILDKVCEPGIDAVVHCAASIVVPDSVADPLAYYRNNVSNTVTMLDVLQSHEISRVIFSSSAAVYADPEGDGLGLTEGSATAPRSPYAWTKLMMEQILSDNARAGGARAVCLRYFNPIGADPRMRTGQQRQRPSHVLGKMIDAWVDGTPFTITGVDFDTPDGTGVRDYIHVWDLANAHVAALAAFDVVTSNTSMEVVNVGRGEGISVRRLAQVFEEATGEPLRIVEGPRRDGDSMGAFAVVERAWDLLGWRAERTVTEGIADAVAWLPHRRRLLGY